MSLGDRMLATENPAARRRAIAGTAAIALHAAVIAGAVVWSAMKVDELPPRPPLLAVIEHGPMKPSRLRQIASVSAAAPPLNS